MSTVNIQPSKYDDGLIHTHCFAPSITLGRQKIDIKYLCLVHFTKVTKLSTTFTGSIQPTTFKSAALGVMLFEHQLITVGTKKLFLCTLNEHGLT